MSWLVSLQNDLTIQNKILVASCMLAEMDCTCASAKDYSSAAAKRLFFTGGRETDIDHSFLSTHCSEQRNKGFEEQGFELNRVLSKSGVNHIETAGIRCDSQ